ncbi:DegT/DnrJ/EryC1/StrS family aminotransferase [Bdellovibrio sp. HCB209]|uniref:DegT/DnrJ/EryC1/StrS family aminotransferase n=1 Tax=Bdellovibrio sp. HCB209 TaxID=3394354 RepID=UPI0039B3A93C
MQVPFLDLSATYKELKSELDEVYFRVMTKGHYIMGDELSRFESEFAKYCGAKYCVGVSNGLDALVLLLKAYGIQPGDEVIVPSNTFIATWLAVSSVGAIPVSVAPKADSFNIDPAKISAAITPKTKAVMPVHLYGIPCDMDEINKIAKQYSLVVIEDAAQAQGANYKGKYAGNLGDAAAFSFYPGKNLGAYGDAGSITTNDPVIYEKVLALRNYGSVEKYVHKVQGHNFRLDELQAGFLRVRLAHLSAWNKKREDIAKKYTESFKGLEVKVPVLAADVHSSWHLFVVQTNRREELRSFLQQKGITTLIHYPIPPAKQEAYADKESFIETESYDSSQLLSLPIGPQMSAEMVAAVIAGVKSFYNKI